MLMEEESFSEPGGRRKARERPLLTSRSLTRVSQAMSCGSRAWSQSEASTKSPPAARWRSLAAMSASEIFTSDSRLTTRSRGIRRAALELASSATEGASHSDIAAGPVAAMSIQGGARIAKRWALAASQVLRCPMLRPEAGDQVTMASRRPAMRVEMISVEATPTSGSQTLAPMSPAWLAPRRRTRPPNISLPSTCTNMRLSRSVTERLWLTETSVGSVSMPRMSSSTSCSFWRAET